MINPEQCDHKEVEKEYFEEPLDEPYYNGIWYVQTSHFYKSVPAFEQIDFQQYQCKKCKKVFLYPDG